MSLNDSFGRSFKTLRISVTDRCDLRCVYCMPADGMAWLPKQDLLSFEELERLAKIFVQAGISRLRLTAASPCCAKTWPRWWGSWRKSLAWKI